MGSRGSSPTPSRPPRAASSAISRANAFFPRPIGEREGANMTLTEWALLPDAEVCVIGRWDVSGALLPHWRRTAGISVYAGKPQEVISALAGESRVYYILTVLLLALLTASVAWQFI